MIQRLVVAPVEGPYAVSGQTQAPEPDCAQPCVQKPFWNPSNSQVGVWEKSGFEQSAAASQAPPIQLVLISTPLSTTGGVGGSVVSSGSLTSATSLVSLGSVASGVEGGESLSSALSELVESRAGPESVVHGTPVSSYVDESPIVSGDVV